MAIETLFDLAKADADASEKEKTLAQNDFTAALKDIADAQTSLTEATKDLTKLQDEAVGLRRKIAETTVAADGAALFIQLDESTTKIRAKQTQILDLEEAIGQGQGRAAAAQGQLDASAAAQKTAEDAKEAAKQRDDTHASWKTAAGGASLSGLPTKADVAVAGDAKTAKDDAEKRLNSADGGDIPEKLFTQAETRRGNQAARVGKAEQHATKAEDKLSDKQADAGLRGETEKALVAFERSVAAMRDFVVNAKDRYDRSLSQLAAVKASTALNADEQKRIADLKTKGEAAITAQTQLITGQDAVNAKLDEIEEARLTALAADPTTDPDTVTAVKTKIDELPALEQTRDQKLAAYTPLKADLDAWETAVPESTWALFDAYATALETLAALKAIDPAQLTTDLDDNEKAYVQAVEAERANERVVIALAALTKGRQSRAAIATQSAPARLLGALRGDD